MSNKDANSEDITDDTKTSSPAGSTTVRSTKTRSATNRGEQTPTPTDEEPTMSAATSGRTGMNGAGLNGTGAGVRAVSLVALVERTKARIEALGDAGQAEATRVFSAHPGAHDAYTKVRDAVNNDDDSIVLTPAEVMILIAAVDEFAPESEQDESEDADHLRAEAPQEAADGQEGDGGAEVASDEEKAAGGQDEGEAESKSEEPKRKVDEEIFRTFVDTVFAGCDPAGYVVPRVFRHEDNKPVASLKPLRLVDSEFIEKMAKEATRAANMKKPAVFCPPLCTFKASADATMENIHEAPVLSLELDSQVLHGVEVITGILGLPTLYVSSGGVWMNGANPELKAHLHYRLDKPAAGEDIKLVERARQLMALLAGGDATTVSPVHPMRWPGSWHTKAAGFERTANIIRSHSRPDFRLNLLETLTLLEAAAEKAASAAANTDTANTKLSERARAAIRDTLHHEGRPHAPEAKLSLSHGKVAEDIDELRRAVAAIPNEGDTDASAGWDHFNKIGMALWAATGGSDEGFAIFMDWCRKAPNLLARNPKEPVRRWQHYPKSPPGKLGAGTLFRMAQQLGWTWTKGKERVRDGDWASAGAEWADAGGEWSDDAQAKKKAPPIFTTVRATDFIPEKLPKRPWVVPGLLMVGKLTFLVAPPGSGKSLISLQIAVMLALGMAWGGWRSKKPCRVLVVNAEDDIEEMQRRLYAACEVMGVDMAEIGDSIQFLNEPEDLVIARTVRKDVMPTLAVGAIVGLIQQGEFGAVIVDPFGETFEGEESSPSEMKVVGKIWRDKVAKPTGAAIMLIHHTRKGSADGAGDADVARGSSSFVGTARVMSTLFTMTEDEAGELGIEARDRHRYARFDDAKSNYELLSGRPNWFEKKTVTLPNGGVMGENGEEVGAFNPWTPGGAFDGDDIQKLNALLDKIDDGIVDGAGEVWRYGDNPQHRKTNPSRHIIDLMARELGVERAAAKRKLKEWMKTGLLFKEDYPAPDRKTRAGYFVDATKRPGSSAG